MIEGVEDNEATARGLRFGTSGLRGLVSEMTDLEVYINVRGFLDYLRAQGDLGAGATVALAQDLREFDPVSGLSSSPRIASAAVRAVHDAGFDVVHCGQIPTPALANFALHHSVQRDGQAMPAIMVTGSHIPPDRNGIKFYRKGCEILKSDEPGILSCVEAVRHERYARIAWASEFGQDDMLLTPAALPPVDESAANAYVDRFASLYAGTKPLAGQRVVLYEHSAVGRDLCRRILETLGAEVLGVDRKDTFVSIDTENISAERRDWFCELAARHRPLAIVSTDGDGDRPMLADETGCFHPGDALGLVTAGFLEAEFVAVPVSSTDAIELWCIGQPPGPGGSPVVVRRTRIGSPFVIEALNDSVARQATAAVGWEANGGFLTATDLEVGSGVLRALPTRDALLPMLAVLVQAAERGVPVSEVFSSLPQRATSAGLLDEFAPEASRAILDFFRPSDPGVEEVAFQPERVSISSGGHTAEVSMDDHDEFLEVRDKLSKYFEPTRYSSIERINYVDGVRISFANGDILHMRPSGNAPQLRAYALSDTLSRAEQLVSEAVHESDGLFRRMQVDLGG